MAQQSGGMPYIGSLISLISKTGVRYEGTLYTIDMQESTIALQDGTKTTNACLSVPTSACTNHAFLIVRSFGTEGRKQDGPQIPASDQLFEFIRFRGKGHQVCAAADPTCDLKPLLMADATAFHVKCRLRHCGPDGHYQRSSRTFQSRPAACL